MSTRFYQSAQSAAPEGHGNAFMEQVEMLRAVSVLLVLLYQFGVPGFSFGYLGVGLCFVISGFLMAQIYGDQGRRDQIVDFLTRRAGRLLPV